MVHGVVQGVGFRWSTQSRAIELGVTGHARNLADGTVEVEAEGTPPAVNELIEWLHDGPRFARVARIEVSEITPTGTPRFRVTG